MAGDPTSFVEVSRWLEEFLWPERDERQRNKRGRILKAATELFVQFGYRKTSIEEVARAAGIAKGTVYLYYQNKAELLFHAIALEKNGFMADFQDLLDGSQPAAQRLSRLIGVGMIRMSQLPLLARMSRGDQEFLAAMQDIDPSVLTRVNDWQTQFISALIDEATGNRLSTDELDARARVFIDLFSAVVNTPQMASRDLPFETYVWSLAGTLVAGVVRGPDMEAEIVKKEAG